jgi:hypothetical protein
MHGRRLIKASKGAAIARKAIKPLLDPSLQACLISSGFLKVTERVVQG